MPVIITASRPSRAKAVSALVGEDPSSQHLQQGRHFPPQQVRPLAGKVPGAQIPGSRGTQKVKSWVSEISNNHGLQQVRSLGGEAPSM